MPRRSVEIFLFLYYKYEEYTAAVKSAANPQCREAVRYILQKNILCGDALTMEQSDGSPIVFPPATLSSGGTIGWMSC